MSTKGIYSALSGAVAQNAKVETIANNIANANTPAFKRDQQVFKEYLAAYERPPDVIPVPKVPASIESFYDMQGGDIATVDIAGTFTDQTQGGIKPTGNQLDIALEGKGFFEVLGPGGVKMTRNGALKINPEGRLVTKDGFPVLRAGTGTEDPASRIISVNSQRLSITSTGEILDDGQSVAQLSLVNVTTPDALQKSGSSLFSLRENMRPALDRAPQLTIHQGYIEMSNVDIVREMTDMIAATRLFEANQKSIKTYDEMAEKLVNSVPRVEG